MEPIRLIRDRRELKGTVYFEFLPGPYKGQCWNESSVFLAEEVFGFIDPLISRHYHGEYYYSFSTIASGLWIGIASDLRNVSDALRKAKEFADVREQLGFAFSNTEAEFAAAFSGNKESLARLAAELASWIEEQIAEREPISLLGL